MVDILRDTSIRITWTSRDRIQMAAHCARHELDLGNYEVVYIDDLIENLGLQLTAYALNIGMWL